LPSFSCITGQQQVITFVGQLVVVEAWRFAVWVDFLVTDTEGDLALEAFSTPDWFVAGVLLLFALPG
jgi:hypothetical protein